MNPFREFLEASNLHGFVYISKAESKWGKVLWTFSIIASFTLAGILINKSFEDWSARPISSVISTHPIESLQFPNVTVCPPKGTNTALNYDLTRLNNTFKPSEWEKIENETKAVFTGDDRIKYVKDLLEVVNPDNLKKIYQGFQTIPTHLNKTGFKIELSGAAGEISTPSLSDYPLMLYVLRFPENLDQLVGGTGKLIIELIIDSDGAGNESVEYKEGPKYEYVRYQFTWQRAEDYCVERGGHLASVSSEIDIGAVYSDFDFVAMEYDLSSIWLGAKKDRSKNQWNWVNGKDWVFEDWVEKSDFNESEDCLISNLWQYTIKPTWTPKECQSTSPFICEYKSDEIITGSKVFVYNKDSLPVQPLHIWWKHKTLKKLLSKKETANQSGLKLNWRIENKFPDLEFVSDKRNGHAETPDFRGKYQEELYLADRRSKFVLQLPDSLEGLQKNSTLVVNLQVETEEIAGWHENVIYSAGSTFHFYPTRKSWDEAEKACIEEGSHLASVRSFAEAQELMKFDVEGKIEVWIGGTLDSTGNWIWVDGQEWNYTNWDKEGEKGVFPQKVSKNTKLVFYDSRIWRNYHPKARLPFICRPPLKTLTGVANRTWEYKAEDLTSSEITIVWEYRFPGEEVLKRWKNPKRTGFSVSWYVSDSNGSHIEQFSRTNEAWQTVHKIRPAFSEQTKWFLCFVNIVQAANEKQVAQESLLGKLADFRESTKLKPADCMNGVIYYMTYLREFLVGLDIAFDETLNSNVSDLALINGFELFSSLHYCPQNDYLDLVLQDFFLSQKSPRALLQGTANVISSGLVVNPLSMVHLQKFSQIIGGALNLDLMYILSKTLSNNDTDAMIKNYHPFSPFQLTNMTQREIKIESLMAEFSSHPVHLTSKNVPSAFIPFCAYNGDLLALGKQIDGIEFPVCNKFVATVLKGQLCYTIDVGSVLTGTKTKDGKSSGLALVLDYNIEKSVQPIKQKQSKDTNTRYLNLNNDSVEEDGEAMVYIQTLKPFEGYGGGSYSLHALKQISPTESFLSLSKAVTLCSNNDKQQCKRKKYIHQKIRSCKCIPWEFPKEKGAEVVYENINNDHLSFLIELSSDNSAHYDILYL